MIDIPLGNACTKERDCELLRQIENMVYTYKSRAEPREAEAKWSSFNNYA